MLKEAIAIARVHWHRLPMQTPGFTAPPDEQTMGWEVSQFRKFRGLE